VNGWDREFLDKIVRPPGIRHCTYSSLFGEITERLDVTVSDGRRATARSAVETGASLACHDAAGDRLAQTDGLTEAGMRSLATHVRGDQAGRPPAWPDDTLAPAAGASFSPAIDGFTDAMLHGLVDAAERAAAEARDSRPRYNAATARVRLRRRRWVTLDSTGRFSAGERASVVARVSCTMPGVRGPVEARAHRAAIALPAVSEEIFRGLARRAAEQAAHLRDARPFAAGTYPIVLCAGAGAVLLHEICGHALEADHQGQGSVLTSLTGRKVAAPQVTIADSPLLPGGWGSYGWDDEGNPAGETVLIDHGVVTGQLTNRTTAARPDGGSSGNARRRSYRYPALPRMSNTYLLPGDRDPAEPLAATCLGLYVAGFRDGHMNRTTGTFSFHVDEGFVIRDGRLAEPVGGLVVAGECLAALAAIDLVATDLRHHPSTCRKEGQDIPVGMGQPTVRLTGMAVCG
jgi:TldD protein